MWEPPAVRSWMKFERDRPPQPGPRPESGSRKLPLLLTLGSCLLTASGLGAEWERHEGYRSLPLPAAPAGQAGFTRLPSASTGVTFTNLLSEERSLTNHILLNGSGVAAGDIDGDGWCDLYFCSVDGPNGLYRNLGHWNFENITAQAGLACPGLNATGAVFCDLDGDGDLDLLINSVGHGTSAFRNDGHGHFQEITSEAGLSSQSGSMSMALADIDGDGDLDLYVVNYRTSTMRDGFNLRLKVIQREGKPVITMVNGRPVTEPDLVGRFTLGEAGNVLEHGEADVLYRNDGSGHFRPIPFTGGAFLDEEGLPLSSPPYDWGLSVMFRDLNGDGAPDLYVCNDLDSVDRIWINAGNGRFRAIGKLALRKTSWFSMGVDAADLNRDGYDEIFVADMLSRDHRKRHTQENDHRSLLLPIGTIDNRPAYARNTLFLNQGDGDYSEIAYFSGVAASDWSWSPVFLDVDLDGYEDLLITTGFERDVQDRDIAAYLEHERRTKNLSDLESLKRRRLFPRLEPPNVAFRNRGNLTFEEVGNAWGFDAREVSQGMALADLDNDGDMDVAINNLNAEATVLRNNSPAPRLAVRLRGKPPNTAGIGAKIKVTLLEEPQRGGTNARSTLPVQTQEMICGGRYLSGDDTMRVFAAGDATNTFAIEVTWRSGARSLVRAKANQLYEIDEAGATVSPPTNSIPGAGAAWFEDVSSLLSHTHEDAPFDDFERQPLLPRLQYLFVFRVCW